jgi:hypothetical protein
MHKYKQKRKARLPSEEELLVLQWNNSNARGRREE